MKTARTTTRAKAPRKAAPRRLAIGRNLDISEAASLKAELLAHVAGKDEAVLDLSGVIEADTAGLQVLLLAQRECARRGGTLRLSGCSLAVADLLELFGLAGSFGAQA
jgi:anti-anti-sigma factor